MSSKVWTCVLLLSLPSLAQSGATSSGPTIPSYNRITPLPAFAVTTHFGSPYMIYDKLSRSETLEEEQCDLILGSSSSLDKDLISPGALMTEDGSDEKQQRTRTTALYFTDPEDASCLVDEMKQMGGGMSEADVRVMCTTLARAVKQSSVLNRGLPTGQPLDEMSGRLRSDQGGMLRYKIVPSRRELFYAARCVGKERVGLFGDSSEEDAKEVMSDLGEKIIMEQSKRKRGGGVTARDRPRSGRKNKQQAPTRADFMKMQYSHMKGKTGIPLFYIHGVKNNLKDSLRQQTKEQIPLFFSYEDCVKAWKDMRQKDPEMPKRPPPVEVFNFVDVVTAIDKEQFSHINQEFKIVKKAKLLVNKLAKKPLILIDDSADAGEGEEPWGQALESIVFVPSSRAIAFKEKTSAKGNGKARLRPMR